jgi:hypothetical protein
MSPRVTFTLRPDGSFDIWVNETGRDLLVKELQGLTEQWDHFHLDHFDDHDIADATEVPLRGMPYRVEDRALLNGKVMLRPDKWDIEHFPQVMTTSSADGA